MRIEDDVPLRKDPLFWFVVICIISCFIIMNWISKNPRQEPQNYIPREESMVRQTNIHYYPSFRYSVLASISGFNAVPEQTDSTPFTMASGKRVYEGAIANNCLEFGTRIKIGEDWYFVEDRMNKRYGCEYFDIFFWSEDEAKQWGRRTIKIEIHN